MMKFIQRLLGNSFLMLVLFAMLFLPIGAMGLAGMQQGSEVLSQTSAQEEQLVETTEQIYQLDSAYETTSSAELGQEIDYP